MKFDHFLHDEKILPIADAVVPLSNIEYAYGFGVYETIRVANSVVYFLNDHIERILESAKIIGLEHTFSQAFIEKGIDDLVSKNHATSYNIKILLIGGSDKDKASLFALCFNPLFPDKKLYKEGVTVISYNHERVFPHAKSLNMLQSYIAYKKARAISAYDALLINRNGFITEGTRTNFFCLTGKIIYSPPEEDILLGVTRKALLKVAQSNGYEIIQQNIGLNDVKNFENAFISSTSSKILPIKKIDSIDLLPPSENLKNLMTLFDNFWTRCDGKI